MEYTTDFTDKDLLNADGCQVEQELADVKNSIEYFTKLLKSF